MITNDKNPSVNTCISIINPNLNYIYPSRESIIGGGEEGPGPASCMKFKKKFTLHEYT